MSMRSLVHGCLILILVLTMTKQAKQDPSSIVSKVKTDKNYVQASLNPKNIYAIDIQRIATSKQHQVSKCRVQQKQIITNNDFQKFRVGSQSGRKKSVYQTLTNLPDKQNGIESFKILGDHIILIMMNGKVHFLNNNKTLQTNPTTVDLKYDIMIGKFKFIPLIAPINGNAFVATPRDVSFCQPKLNKCTKIQGFKGVDSLYNFFAYEYKNKQYLFFIAGLTLTTYEVSANGIAFNEKNYDAAFFNKSKIYLEDVIPIPGNKLLILDFYAGVMEVEHSVSSLGDIKDNSKIVYDQYGCRHMTSQKQGQYLALQCSLTQKTFFILQLIRTQGSSKYTAQQPIFFNEVLTGIGSNLQMIMANIFSGVRLFWASIDLQSPYPYDYQRAGSIFLHNAKGSQISTLNGRKVIYIFTQDQLRIYQLTVKNAQVVCYSLLPIKQEYKLTYTYLCDRQSVSHSKVCTAEKKLTYQAWQHKQVGFKATLLPLLVSFILVVGIGMLLVKLYRKYDQEIQHARLKYNTNQQFAIQG